MKVSVKWLSQYVDIKDISAQKIADTLTNAGIEVESIETLASGSDLVVGHVLSCEKHPDSDHLSVTTVDVKDEILNIVCGAPNVAQGQKVIVAKVGCVLPEITIKEAMIKGQVSKGMICSLTELGVDRKNLRDDQINGIEVLANDAPIGVEALAYCGLDDVILDVKPTPNRADIQAIWSLALEVGALLNREVNLPWVKDLHKTGTKSNLHVDSLTQKCPIILGKRFGSLKVKASPEWMTNALHAVGMKSINNVVDISNYVMLETGQPLHFYDASKLAKQEIVVADHVTKDFETLDGTVITPHENDLIITCNDTPIGLAGIMGGEDSKIDESTTSIIIEAAQFNPSSIRHSSRRVNLMTEASLRFQKGLDPQAALKAMDRCVALLTELADAKEIEETQIVGDLSYPEKFVSVTHQHIEDLLGQEVDETVVLDIFTRLHFKPCVQENNYTCSIPSYRLDIFVSEDLIEEVGRILGYEQLPNSLPLLPATQGGYTAKQTLRNQVHERLIGFGLNEVMTYTLVHEDKTKIGVNPLKDPAILISPISEERRVVRNNILPSILESVSYNQAHKMKDFGVYELSNLNTIHESEERVAIVLSGQNIHSLWRNQQSNYDFYALKGMVESLLTEMGFGSTRISYEAVEDHLMFHPKRCVKVMVDKKNLGLLGEIHPSYAKSVDVSQVTMCELSLETLYNLKQSKVRFNPINKYPSVIRDLAFVVEQSTSAAQIEKVIKNVGKQLIKQIDIFDVYEGEHIGLGLKSIALKIVYQAKDHTFTEEEITELYTKTIEECQKQLKAKLRS